MRMAAFADENLFDLQLSGDISMFNA